MGTPSAPASGPKGGTSRTAASAGIRRWRTVDIVVTAALGVAIGLIFWFWNLLWQSAQPLFLAFPPAQGFMYGVWLLPGVLAGLIIRKPGAAVFASLSASVVSALLGSTWGLMTVLYGLLQGLAPELVFVAGRYRRWGVGAALTAGTAAGLTAAALDLALYYPTWSALFMAVYAALLAASAAVIAGGGGKALTTALARAGALAPFPSGRG